MTRETSIEAYRFVMQCGFVGEKQREIYDVLYRYGPMTSAEVYSIILRNKPARAAITHTRARFSELRAMGAIEEDGEKICTITGRRVILWKVTTMIPVKFEKPTKHKCKSCNGKGYIQESQARLF